MTKKQIKQIIMRGLGRGILAVREDPERYREIVLWACSSDMSYDTQCEGTRAWYNYQLITCYPDCSEFRDLAERKLLKQKKISYWDFRYNAELLMYLSKDGDQSAEHTLWKAYADLLDRLKGFRRISISMRDTADCFESLCDLLSWNEENYVRIASDIGGLFLSSTLYGAEDFVWLHEDRPRRFNTLARRKAATSAELSAFCSALDDWKQQREEWKKNRPERMIPEEGRPLSVYLKREATELAPAYADAYLTETDPEARAAVLEAFSVCPYPLDPSPILEDAQSDHPVLRVAALAALCELRHPSVRRFAMEHLDEDPFWYQLIAIRNYEPSDEADLKSRLTGLKIDSAETSFWHAIHMQLLDLFDRDSGVAKPPKSLLPIMYESTLCASCRCKIVRLMCRYHIIEKSMWEELTLDCNSQTRDYAVAHLARAAGKSTSGLDE